MGNDSTHFASMLRKIKVDEPTPDETENKPILEDGKVVGWETPDGKRVFATGLEKRGRLNIAYNYQARKRMERSALASERRQTQRHEQRTVIIDDRDQIPTEVVYLTPKNSISAIVKDAETLAEIEDKFEVLTVGMNGFAVIDLLDGKFEDFQDFAREHKLKVFDFPLATYYLNSNSVSCDKISGCVPVKEHQYATVSVSSDDLDTLDRLVRNEVLIPDAKGSIDLFISTCKYLGFDETITEQLIKNYFFSKVTDREIEQFLFSDLVSEFTENDPMLRRKIEQAKRSMFDPDLEKIVLAVDDSGLISFVNSARESLEGSSALAEYIKLQLRDDVRKNNYNRTIGFWDTLDQEIRNICKTGIVRKVVKKYDSRCDNNNQTIRKFLEVNPAIKNKLEVLANDYSDNLGLVDSELSGLNTEITGLGYRLGAAKFKYNSALKLSQKEIDQSIEYAAYKAKNLAARRLLEVNFEHGEMPFVFKKSSDFYEWLKNMKDFSEAELSTVAKETASKMQEISFPIRTAYNVNKLYSNVKTIESEQAVLVAEGNKLYKTRRQYDETAFFASSFLDGRLVLQRQIDHNFISKLEQAFLDQPSFESVFKNLIVRYRPLTLEEVADVPIKVTKENIQDNLKQFRDVLESIIELANESTPKIVNGPTDPNCVKEQNEPKEIKLIKDSARTLTGLINDEECALGDVDKYDSISNFYIVELSKINNRMFGLVNEIEKVSLRQKVKLGTYSSTMKLRDLLDSRTKIYQSSGPVFKNIANSLEQRQYLDLLETSNQTFVSKGKLFNELESKGDFCPLGLSSNWYTKKLCWTPRGVIYRKHFFNTPTGKVVDGNEPSTKIEFNKGNNSFVMNFKNCKSMRLTRNQLEGLLTDIETYALDALLVKHNIPEGEVAVVPNIEFKNNQYVISGNNQEACDLHRTYEAFKKVIAQNK